MEGEISRNGSNPFDDSAAVESQIQNQNSTENQTQTEKKNRKKRQKMTIAGRLCWWLISISPTLLSVLFSSLAYSDIYFSPVAAKAGAKGISILRSVGLAFNLISLLLAVFWFRLARDSPQFRKDVGLSYFIATKGPIIMVTVNYVAMSCGWPRGHFKVSLDA